MRLMVIALALGRVDLSLVFDGGALSLGFEIQLQRVLI